MRHHAPISFVRHPVIEQLEQRRSASTTTGPPRGDRLQRTVAAQGEGPPTGPGPRVRCYNPPRSARLKRHPVNAPPFFRGAMTSEQAAQLIDNTLDLVHQRLQDLEAQALPQEHKALAAEFREWRQPSGGHIDLMVFPGLSNS